MRKIWFYIVPLFFLFGCEDFLDVDNLTKKDTSTVPTTEEDVEMLITAAYQNIVQIAPLNNPFFMSELVSDDRFGAAGQSDRDNRAIGRLKRNGENQFGTLWSKLYSVIYRVHNILDSMDMVEWSSEEARTAVEGEVLFLRAYAYMNLCRVYGTVPLVLTSERVNLPRATPDELWGQIGADYKAAIEKLPAQTYQDMDKSRLGHATKWAAEALMARAWLFYTGYYEKEELALPDGFLYRASLEEIGEVTEVSQEGCILAGSYKLAGCRHDLLDTARLPAGGGTVYAAGTAPDMECRLTCTVGAAAESYLMAGILWVDVKAGDVLCLDGINRAVTKNGANALGQCDLTRWPLLAAGRNVLTCPDALTVEYYPIYL